MYKIVPKINPHIFRGYDIRGVVDADLSEDVMYTLARGYATWLSARRITEAIVGHDNRLTSPQYSQAFIKGLNDGGINTIELGYSLSQIVYFSSYYFQTKGSAMLTASHNPKEYNGLKLGTGYSETMVTEEIQQIQELCKVGVFSKGQGTNRKESVYQAYEDCILKHFSLKKKWKIVVDTCNTTSGMFYPKLFRQAGCEVIEQNTEPDGNFPSGVPDPTEVEVLERLGAGVRKAKADLGFAYDTDGDRMAVVDERGTVLWMDTIVAIFAKDILDFLPGSPIVYNTFCSRQVTDAIASKGGIPVIERTGHSFIKARVKKENAPFGGEMSGHIFFMDNFFGHDDGAFASLRLLSYLERHNQSLSAAVGELTKYISSPEVKLGLADNIKFEFVDKIIGKAFRKEWPDAEYVTIDGVRMDYSDKMAIVRASQNGPYIGLKFEAQSLAEFNKIKHTLRTMLKAHPEIDWSKGVNIHALD